MPRRPEGSPLYLRSLTLDRDAVLPDVYPFSVPAIATLDRLDFRAPVTFFAGENASGKSTLLEAIAAAANSTPVRDDDQLTRETLLEAEVLGAALRIEWRRKTRQGFFLRAEDFFDFKKHLVRLAAELAEAAAGFDATLEGYGRQLARGAVLGQQQALIQRYGGDLNGRSHGESFLQFFATRFRGPGLYLLDEPDTALSPQSVLGLITMLLDMTHDGAQFIVATHSPILLALPGAAILSFDRSPVAQVAYDDLEQITLMRSFLTNPAAYLRHLA